MGKENLRNMPNDKIEQGISPFRYARENIVPDDTRTPETPGEFVEAATNAVIVGKKPELNTVSDASFVALSKIEAIEQNNNLSTSVRKFAEGLKDNIKEWSDHVGGDKKIGEVIRADQMKGLQEVDLIDAKDLPGTDEALKIAAKAGTAGILAFHLAGCAGPINNNSGIETPSTGEAVTIGLLSEAEIDNLPSGEVKDSLQVELDSVKKDCAEVPGCMEDTIQIYRVNVNDENEGVNVFSYRFANIDNAEGLRTQILSIMDGKTKETTTINKDLIAKDTKIDGIPTRVFGYIDDLGNSHYILVDRQTQNGDVFQIYDADGDVYDVITQNEKEVQAYSHLWQEPSIVKAEALPTPTQEPTSNEALSMDALDLENYKIVEGMVQEKRGDNWQEVSIPYEAGYIAYIEIHEGKAYGIDTAERAVVVRNEAGEWEKFERPIYGVDFDNYKKIVNFDGRISEVTYDFDTENVDISDIFINEVSRLTKSDRSLINWGYIKGSYGWKEFGERETEFLTTIDGSEYVDVSGYFLGVMDTKRTVYGHATGITITDNVPVYVFEIPYKYNRQIILLESMVTGKDGYTINYGDIYKDGTSETIHLQRENFEQFLNTNIKEMRGKQVVLTLSLDVKVSQSQELWKSLYLSEPCEVTSTWVMKSNNVEHWFPAGFKPE